MKISFLFTVLALTPLSFGDEKQVEQNKSSIEDAPVLDEVSYKKGKDTLVIQRIEQPEFLEKIEAEEVAPSAKKHEEPKEAPLPLSTFVISATAHGEKGTKIRMWPSHLGEQNALEGWSNVNWSYFQNLISIKGTERNFQFMLFQSAARPKTGDGSSRNDDLGDFPEVPTELPEFQETGSRYLVTSGVETERAETLDFLEALHVLYDEKHQELRQNREEAVERQGELARQVEKEEAKPKTRVLRIWRHTRPEVDENNE